MKRFALIVMAIALTAVACGESIGTTATTTPPPPPTTAPPATTTMPPSILPPLDPNARILQVRLEESLVPPGTILNRMPMYTLFGDGRLIYEGPSPAIWPGPLMPAMLQVDIGSEGLADVLADVSRVGLPRMLELYNGDAANQVIDGPNTVVTYFDVAGEHLFSVYALRDADHNDPRVLLLADLVNRLDQLAADSPSVGPVEVERLQVLANAATVNLDVPLSVVEQWPLSITPADMTELDFAVRCFVIAVPEESDAFEAFQNAHQMSFFEFEDVPYRFTVRPLLTGETGCVPLDG